MYVHIKYCKFNKFKRTITYHQKIFTINSKVPLFGLIVCSSTIFDVYNDAIMTFRLSKEQFLPRFSCPQFEICISRPSKEELLRKYLIDF